MNTDNPAEDKADESVPHDQTDSLTDAGDSDELSSPTLDDPAAALEPDVHEEEAPVADADVAAEPAEIEGAEQGLTLSPFALPQPFDGSRATAWIGQGVNGVQVDSSYLYRAYTDGAGNVVFGFEGQGATLYNGIGFNSLDNFIYGMARDVASTSRSGQNFLVRIGQGGVTQNLGVVPGLPAFPDYPDGSRKFEYFNKGSIQPGTNRLFLHSSDFGGSPDMYVVDVQSKNSWKIVLNRGGVPMTNFPNTSDWTFSSDGYIWAFYGGRVLGGAESNPEFDGTNVRKAFRIDPSSGNVSVFDIRHILPTKVDFGGQWQYGNGDFGLSDNSTGDVYQVRISNSSSSSPTFTRVRVQTGPSSENNDGTSNPGKPVDMRLEKSADKTEVSSGGTITYKFKITNNGPGTSSGYYVYDDLPVGIKSASTSSPGCSISGSAASGFKLFCNGRDGMQPGQNDTVTVTAVMPDIAVGQPAVCLTNSASVIGNEEDTNTGNNTSSVQVCAQPPTPPVQPVDLRMEKLVDKTVVASGGTIVYTLRVTNNGPGTSTGHYVYDDLPIGIKSATTSSPGCSISGSATNGFKLFCNGAGGLQPGHNVTVTVTATMPDVAAAQPAVCLTNSASVVGFGTDPNSGNNASSVQVCAQPPTPAPGKLTIKKNLPDGRLFAPDQFGLQGFKWDDGDVNKEGTPLGDVTLTQGTQSGLQSDVFVSTVPVAGGEEILIRESLNVFVAERYETSVLCYREGPNGIVLEFLSTEFVQKTGSVRYGKLAFPTIPGASVVCVFTNTVKALPSGTLTIKKNLPDGRSVFFDQFTLQGFTWDGSDPNNEGAQLGDPVTTEGLKTGMQDETFVSTVPVIAGQEVLVQESFFGPDSNRYETSLSCDRVDDGGTVLESVIVASEQMTGDIRTGKLTFPTIPGASVVCVFTNAFVKGSASWEKVDESGNRLEGSAWALKSSNNLVIDVEDCVAGTAAECSASGGDVDPRPGYFKVLNLDWAEWTLSETRAPAGFTLSGETKVFIVGSGGVIAFDLGQIVNTQIEVPAIPLTGGLGEHIYLISAGALGAVIALLLIMRQRRRSKFFSRNSVGVGD